MHLLITTKSTHPIVGCTQVEQLEQSLWSITKSKSQLEEQLRLAQHELQESQSYIEQLEAHCEGLQVITVGTNLTSYGVP